MVLDEIHLKRSHDLLHPSFSILGHEFVIDVPIHTLILAIVGGAFLFRHVLKFVRLMLETFIWSGKSIKSYKSTGFETWAVVTGCTSGIGLEFARELAWNGFALILVGRRPDALGEVAGELESKYKIRTKTVSIDLDKPDSRAHGFAELEKLAKELNIGILINNAGISHEMPIPFAETEIDDIETIIQTNVAGTLSITRAILPSMIARSTKRKAPRSLILNIGSLSGRIPSPWLATYSGTKGGLQTWTAALGDEVKKQGIDVSMVFPAFVSTKISKIRKTSIFVPSPKSFVQSTFDRLLLPVGAQGRPYQSTPYWTHAFMDYVTGLFGYLSEKRAMGVIFSMHKDIRKRALRKKEREAEKSKKE